MTRRVMRTLARGVIGCLLFMQFAIAAYACPAGFQRMANELPSSSAEAAVDQLSELKIDLTSWLASESSRWIGGLDADSTNLCAEHCKSGQQSDQASTIVVPAALLTPRYLTPHQPDGLMSQRYCAAPVSALVAATPPHAILHCVRRT